MRYLIAALAILPFSAVAIAQPQPARQQLSAADSTAAFRAAGFVRKAKQWRKCDDPGTAGYSPGTISDVRDINGDGRPEVMIVEGSSYCHGMTGEGTTLVSKQANGSWKVMFDDTGVVSTLATKGVGGWPDLQIGGPGFCFPVLRWNGTAYVLQRHEYEGKRCRPPR